MSAAGGTTGPGGRDDEWDVVVLGAGPAGENAAWYATRTSGLSAVLVERELLGGECSYWACMPSKALLRPGEVLAEARAQPGLPGAADLALDVPALLAHRDTVVHGFDDGSQADWARGAGIDVVRGTARLDGGRRVRVRGAGGGERVLTARHAVVLATGSRPRLPDVPGLAAARPWTSRDVTALREVPGRVAVLGGGVVACEAATWLRDLGARVSVVHRGGSLLSGTEPFAGRLVAAALAAGGVDLRPGTGVLAVHREHVGEGAEGRVHGGPVVLDLSDGSRLEVDELLVATGRVPATEDLGLGSVGLEDGAVPEVDGQLTVRGVDGRWLYAVGDVSGRAATTHLGKYHGRVAGEVIAARAAGRALDPGPGGRHRDRAVGVAVPQVVFTSPPVVSVGLTEEQARAAGRSVAAVEVDLGAVAGAYLHDPGYTGRAKLVVDPASDTVVGMTAVGAGTPELLHSATVAIAGAVPLAVLWHAVPAYPTVSEVWLRLLEAWDDALG